MWVSFVAKWPPARVATQPPRVENSNDCGKWRRVSPRSASWSSRSGPSAPAWIRAASETSSTSSTRSSRPRSIVTTPCVLVADPRLDPADDAGAAAEGNRGEAVVGAPGEDPLEVGLVAGPGDDVRRAGELAAEAADDVAVGLAERVRGAVVVVGAAEVRERAGRLDPRRAQLDRVQRDRLGDLLAPEPEPLADAGRRRFELLAPERRGLPAPAPVLAAVGGGYQWTPRVTRAKVFCSAVPSAAAGSSSPSVPGFEDSFAAFVSGKSL